MAVANYHADFGSYPPAYTVNAEGIPQHSWRVLILPYMEQQHLYERFDLSQPWNSPENLKLVSEMPAIYAFQGGAHRDNFNTNYFAVVGDHTMWPGSLPRKDQEIIDDVATTILLAENSGLDILWTNPVDLPFSTWKLPLGAPSGISSRYEDSAVALTDGSLRRLKASLAPTL